MQQFDIVIIGSGMGGLVCGDLLSREGYQVCIIEKNKQLGGCLQTYARDKKIFDSGVHYLGGLDKGQNLWKVFQYMGLMDRLKLERMDDNCFDKIIIENDRKEYSFAQGYENFISTLLKDFPDDEDDLRAYCDEIRDICSRFPLYNLRTGGKFEEKGSSLETDTETFIASYIKNPKLQAVLAGNNILYAGQRDKTPVYVHALIQNHYIESSWKCINGGSQISKFLAANIRDAGGVILRNAEVKAIAGEDGLAAYAELADGSRIYGKQFISNLHPLQTINLLRNLELKAAYRNRIKMTENTVSSFTINIVLKKNTVPYMRHNVYFQREGKAWTMAQYSDADWPLGYALFHTHQQDNHEFAESASVITYMHYKEVEKWASTVNTTNEPCDRGDDYKTFKHERAEKLLSCVYERFPLLKESIVDYYVATPLSYRDYIGNGDGSMYGIAKDYNEPFKTLIPARTRIPNLFLTGQNLNLHGVLGATMSGVVTTITIMGNESVIEKINNA